ncbi:NWD2 [Coprinopsis cinerea okayama7|uniref:NWD2 n=1 Tax=Coprinopsis cinerea (strain Okayama-7 / 130 / ATCC MYA-4618 / FGSC 9003) TaxID=240176 RepID=A8PBR8_COPC7|nr:NWD2 [Coprinopsis cinerea okayama7\|eukprot:XP_001840254.2 NWD2 [Coprinopsis cinerea okayama7\
MPLFENSHHFTINGGTFNDFSQSHGLEPLVYLERYAATGATHDSADRFPPPRCHAETRIRVLDRITTWAARPRAERPKSTFWLHGPVGMGKTTIAQTVAEELDAMDLLGASFFFSRADPNRDKAAKFVASLALQLALSIPQLKPHIEEAVVKNPTVLTKALPIQLKKLIVEPFRKIPPLEEDKTVLIDGLDECDGVPDKEEEQFLVLELIQTLQQANLPLIFFLTSRPESWIEEAFDELTALSSSTERFDLFQSSENDADVERFLRDNFYRILTSPKHRFAMSKVKRPWPSEETIRTIVRDACGQFAYVDTIIRFIDDPYSSPVEQLDIVLRGTTGSHLQAPLQRLDTLYRQILEACPKREEMLCALGCLDAMGGALPTMKQVDAFQLYDTAVVRREGAMARSLRALHAVVRMPAPECNLEGVETVESDATSTASDVLTLQTRFYHNSFQQFIRSSTRAGAFHCDFDWFVLFVSQRCLAFLSRTSTPDQEPDSVYYNASRLWPYSWYKLKTVPFKPDTDVLFRQFIAALLSRDTSIEFVRHGNSTPGDGPRFMGNILQLGFEDFPFSWQYWSIQRPPRLAQCISHLQAGYDSVIGGALSKMDPGDLEYLKQLVEVIYTWSHRPPYPLSMECRRESISSNDPLDSLYFRDVSVRRFLHSNGLPTPLVASLWFLENAMVWSDADAWTPVIVYSLFNTEFHSFTASSFRSEKHGLYIATEERISAFCNYVWSLVADEIVPADQKMPWSALSPITIDLTPTDITFLNNPSAFVSAMLRSNAGEGGADPVGSLYFANLKITIAVNQCLIKGNVSMALAILDFADVIEQEAMRLTSGDDSAVNHWPVSNGFFKDMYDALRRDPASILDTLCSKS